MIRYIITKIIHKYKLYLCLEVGVISIVMICSMIMQFRGGSLNKLIQSGYTESREINQVFPTTVHYETALKAAERLKDGVAEGYDGSDTPELMEEIFEKLEANWKKRIPLPVVATQRMTYFREMVADYSYRGEGRLDVGYMEDTMLKNDAEMEQHFVIRDGVYFGGDISPYVENGKEIPEGAVPCLVGETLAGTRDLVPGEILSFNETRYGESWSEDPVLTLYICGIVAEKEGDYFWHTTLDKLDNLVIVPKDDFVKVTMAFPKDAVYYQDYLSFDYRYINTKNIDKIWSGVRKLKKEDREIDENLSGVIKSYKQEGRAVKQMLYVIVLPLALLVLVFIGMIAFRIVDSESGELSTLQRRGLGRGRIFLLYVLQSLILVLVVVLPGIICGYFLGHQMAKADDFMHFAKNLSLTTYTMNSEMVLAGIVGGLVSILFMLWPVLVFFTKKKEARGSQKGAFWERYYLDVALLAVSLYLLFNYKKQLSQLSESVLTGKGIDPVIFVNATVFLLACGMMMLRLVYLLAELLYKFGHIRFSPALFAGMLQILRSRSKSSMISIFLVMTVAMSCFHANMARTINANKQERLQYECGADLRIDEHWIFSFNRNAGTWRWPTPPDYATYEKLLADGTFKSITQVILDDRCLFKKGKKNAEQINLMGIHTKEFGETARMRDGLLPEHWYNMLNELSKNPEGVILSKNLAEDYEVAVGDLVLLQRVPPEVVQTMTPYAEHYYQVVGIVDAWPGYDRYHYTMDEEGEMVVKESYLAIMNIMQLTGDFESVPYEVWADTDLDAGQVRAKLETEFAGTDRYLNGIRSWKEDLAEEKSSSIMQITNGIFSADFLVALFLCMIGYMIYWLTSIRDRELLFGIYRAMGISKNEINRMLGIEQIFLSVTSILAGVLAGCLASWLFAPVFAAVYLPKKHNVPVFISAIGGDIFRILLILLVVVALCIVILRRIVGKLNITEALKLGDD